MLTKRLSAPSRVSLVIAVVLAGSPPSAKATVDQGSDNPMRFFEGRTEMVSTVKVLMSTPYRSRTTGNGEILSDGTLALTQRVHEEGKPVAIRRWKIKQVDDGKFAGTMSEAVGPVIVQDVGESYRFRFKMRGGLAVDQWITPLADGRSATSSASVRKLGMRVATSRGVIRRL